MVEAAILYVLIMLVWFIMIIRPREYLRWLSWKKKAKLAISNGRTTQCGLCHDHIFPGDKVVRHQSQFTHLRRGLVHISDGLGHFSFKSRRRVCGMFTSNQKNLGTWNGSQFVPNPNSIQVS